MVAIAEFLGQGLYTPAEVALYVRESTGVVKRWLIGNKTGEPVVERQFEDENRFVSFLDFVQTLAIAHIRRQYAIPLQTIRQAVDHARNRGVDYPLAIRHKTFLYDRAADSGEEILDPRAHRDRRYELVIKHGDDLLEQATGRNRGNLMLREIAEFYLTDLDFDADGLARAYTPFRLTEELKIQMDPKRRFGEPLTPTGYTAYMLAEAVRTEGSIERAASAYGVDPKEVELACRYLDFLRIAPRSA